MNLDRTEQKKWFLYRHIRLDKNEVFYVGIGLHITDGSLYKRAYQYSCRNAHWRNIVNKTQFRVDIIVENLTVEEVIIKEKEFIKLYGRRDLGTGTLCNLTDGGEGNQGRSLTEETKKKISASHMGKTMSAQACINMSKGMKGRRISEKVKQYLRIKYKGRRPSIQTIEGGIRCHSKKVIQKDMDGNFIKEWSSLSEAARSVGTKPGNISSVCKERKWCKSAAGFKWEYKK